VLIDEDSPKAGVYNSGKKTMGIILKRLKLLETNLKQKFTNNWISVRKAFLDLDYDQDGYVIAEDIMRFFGASNRDIDFNDLLKLFIEKDSKKQGRLSYADFSNWMGAAIHQTEGFYFRHDCIKNPQFEENQER